MIARKTDPGRVILVNILSMCSAVFFPGRLLRNYSTVFLEIICEINRIKNNRSIEKGEKYDESAIRQPVNRMLYIKVVLSKLEKFPGYQSRQRARYKHNRLCKNDRNNTGSINPQGNIC